MNINQLSIQRKILKVLSLSAMLVSSSFASPALADEALNKPVSNDLYANWIRATDDELAQLRGGFTLPNGMIINFSLERMILSNDAQLFSSFFQFPENAVLLQHGDHNLAPDSIGSTLGTVIQNSLDDQAIKTINQINIEIGNLQNLQLNHNHTGIDFILPNLR
ncbi:hypothetical protein [Nitrosomonas sp. Nm33]|uniref:hypothetical protein n=1 Tax=Nitrosomonas sp. Nm33 TaxID=133724 RepID=UPI0008984967|nr:hypothetical protein [Nitrosomonas sp. Nm33]SDY99918.1 hypothetical protein SAMN05421755_10802 [Nitrosomonas sp. Nm33]